ncbi:two-component sensor histidine kinase [Marinomonas sp. A79]|uniref:histidine kinase n=1 Tax=Marinomonas vulgaris TaxID=2823372 RepID=A0ABS5HAE9_9GAMM|nr:ATP-binding protein [Marinomonas vulgaris]MBR7888643.1 two-component sensor histidine kinase [Marinomonas vulgaris]
MQIEMRRLYRNLVVGGVAIIVSCYFAMTLVQGKLNAAKTQQLLYLDGQISAILLLSDVAPSVPESQFSWSLKSPEPLAFSQIITLLAEETHLSSLSNTHQMRFGSADSPFLVGTASQDILGGRWAAMLTRLFDTSLFSSVEKRDLLSAMTYLSITEVTPSQLTFPLGVTPIQPMNAQFAFVWHDGVSPPIMLSNAQSAKLSQTLILVVLVALGIALMIILVWRELKSLDGKRKAFESITRQIARGRSGLPKGIPDSSGTLKELAYSFDSMSSHIQRLLKVQREMINAISHELRTPIARLRFGLEMVKDEVDDGAIKTIEALEGDVEELNTLVDEVLTYGKLEDGSLELSFKECPVFQLIDDILRHNHLLLQHLTVDVKIDEDSLVLADEHHLSRALQNLILNAAKYASSRIVVTFSADTERWQLDIEDDGPGIPFEDRDKVFIPFQRLDNSRTRASGGYGLGLAIVQRIAFWHGGAVLIDESESGGAKFSFIWSRNQHQSRLT